MRLVQQVVSQLLCLRPRWTCSISGSASESGLSGHSVQHSGKDGLRSSRETVVVVSKNHVHKDCNTAHRLLVSQQPRPLVRLRETMRKILLTNLLIASLALHSCSDGSATVVTDRVGPEAPINEPDPSIFSGTGAGGEESAAPSNGSESGTGSPGTGEGGEALEEPTGGQAGNGSNGNGSGGTGEGPNPGGEGGGGNPSSGQPVPEPGTLLLFGTGLAGIGASLLRRRRRDEETPAAE